jgi:hypothetical protein
MKAALAGLVALLAALVAVGPGVVTAGQSDGGQAAVLREITHVDEEAPSECSGDSTGDQLCEEGGGVDLVTLVNDLLDKGLWLIVILAPLAMMFGAGMMFLGRGAGPQLMAAAIVGVVLGASMKGIAA